MLPRTQTDRRIGKSLYKSITRVQSSDFRSQYGLKGQLPEPRFYGYVHTDPTLLSLAVLIGVRNHLLLSGNEGTTQCDIRVGVLSLEEHITSSINDALRDSARALSDQILVAVALCAAYELKHGDPRRFHVHMHGLVQMIRLRGGLSVIGRGDPYIKQFLLWMDVNTSALGGGGCYLQGSIAESGVNVEPSANSRAFRARHEGDCGS